MKRMIAVGLLGLLPFAPAHALDLENAREMDLDGLAGLGPATTRQILIERERRPFRDWQDLMQRIPGIGLKKAEQLSNQGLRVQGRAFEAPRRRQASGP